MDFLSGAADPYIVIKVEGQEAKTETKKKTLEPKWDEEFGFRIEQPAYSELQLLLFDSDTLGRDEVRERL